MCTRVHGLCQALSVQAVVACNCAEGLHFSAFHFLQEYLDALSLPTIVVRPLFSRFANRLATGVLRKHRLQLSRISGPCPGPGRLYSLSRK